MTIQQLHIWLQPLINFLGTVCLYAMVSAGTLAVIIWVVRRIWRFVLAAGAIIAVAALILLSLG